VFFKNSYKKIASSQMHMQVPTIWPLKMFSKKKKHSKEDSQVKCYLLSTIAGAIGPQGPHHPHPLYTTKEHYVQLYSNWKCQ
jgi:hypothetical protein